MAYNIINLFQELGISTSVTKVEDILSEMDKQIKIWQQRVNNPKYKFEAPAHTAALKKLKAEVQTNPTIIKLHAEAYFEKSQERIEKGKTIGVEDITVSRGNMLKNYLRVYSEIENRALIQKRRVIKDAGKLFIKGGSIKDKDLHYLATSFNLSEKEILHIIDIRKEDVTPTTIFGIDFGSTYSCISYIDEFGHPVIIPNSDISPFTPSVVAFEEGGIISVGQAAKEMLCVDPYNVCCWIKRQLGNRDYRFYALGQEYEPEVISAMILKKLAMDAGEVLGQLVKNVVISCPAYFGVNEREATRQAGIIAGLNVIDIINEPIAAAISYGLKIGSPQTVMVYDLGGDTFDVTIIQNTNGEIRIVATGGDNQLGGKDWDDAICEVIIDKYSKMTGESTDSVYDDIEVMGDLELKAETAKKQLTQKNSAVVRLNGQKIEITKEEFESHTIPFMEMTINITHQIMKSASLKGIASIDKILLSGGGSLMPQVIETLNNEFPNIPIEFNEPNFAVAKGAAIFGTLLKDSPIWNKIVSDDKDWGIQDDKILPIPNRTIVEYEVLSQSIGIKLCDNDEVSGILNIIKKNSCIPITKQIQFATSQDNQTFMSIDVFENNSSEEYVSEDLCKPLFQGELGPLPAHLPKGTPIELLFNITVQGLLTIDAKDPTGGSIRLLEVQLRNVLSNDEEVEAEMRMFRGLKVY